MDDSNLNLEPIDGVNSHEVRRGNHLPQWLAILIVLLALVTLVLMIMLISAAQDSAKSAASNTGTASGVSSTETTVTKVAPIIVIWVEEWLSENGALSENSSSRPTTTRVSTKPDPAPVEPAQPTAPAVEQEAALTLTGVDEDIASARARSAGLTPYSVYTFPAIAASAGVSLPPTGQVFRWEPFNGRVEGEKFAFLYVQTTEPLGNAVSVPSLQGKSWRDAQSSLAKAGLNIRYEYEHESPSTYGTVVFQAPSSGSLMPRGCSVMVVLAD